MESKEGGSINRPPVLDGTNYGYWKARMCAFLKSLNSKTWKAVINGWEAPKAADAEGKSTGPKPEKDWSTAEDEASQANSRALNAIFNGVNQNVFRLINTCTSAKVAWDTLDVAYEGTSKVREQKLQY